MITRWNDELYHHGVLGMKWGVRNEETKARYLRDNKAGKLVDKVEKNVNKVKKYEQKVKKHGRRPAVTFSWNSGIDLVFGSRASAIRRAKLKDLKDEAERKNTKLGVKLQKLVYEDNGVSDIPIKGMDKHFDKFMDLYYDLDDIGKIEKPTVDVTYDKNSKHYKNANSKFKSADDLYKTDPNSWKAQQLELEAWEDLEKAEKSRRYK